MRIGDWVKVRRVAKAGYGGTEATKNIRSVSFAEVDGVYGQVAGMTYWQEGRYVPGGIDDAPHLAISGTVCVFRIATSWRTHVHATKCDLEPCPERMLPVNRAYEWTDDDRSEMSRIMSERPRDHRGRFLPEKQ